MARDNKAMLAAAILKINAGRDNDTEAVDGQAREAQEPPALTDGGGSIHQDQGAQVDDVPVVDDAVDESDDAPAEAPPIEGREVDAPADALAAPEHAATAERPVLADALGAHDRPPRYMTGRPPEALEGDWMRHGRNLRPRTNPPDTWREWW